MRNRLASRLRSLVTHTSLAMLALALMPSAASAQQVEARAQVISVVESGAFIDVQLKVSVANNESSVASNVFVLFEDGLQIGLGDVEPGQSVVSATQTERIDVSDQPSHHIPVPVTVTFTFNGGNMEQAQRLLVDRPAAPDPVQ